MGARMVLSGREDQPTIWQIKLSMSPLIGDHNMHEPHLLDIYIPCLKSKSWRAHDKHYLELTYSLTTLSPLLLPLFKATMKVWKVDSQLQSRIRHSKHISIGWHTTHNIVSANLRSSSKWSYMVDKLRFLVAVFRVLQGYSLIVTTLGYAVIKRALPVILQMAALRTACKAGGWALILIIQEPAQGGTTWALSSHPLLTPQLEHVEELSSDESSLSGLEGLTRNENSQQTRI